MSFLCMFMWDLCPSMPFLCPVYVVSMPMFMPMSMYVFIVFKHPHNTWAYTYLSIFYIYFYTICFYRLYIIPTFTFIFTYTFTFIFQFLLSSFYLSFYYPFFPVYSYLLRVNSKVNFKLNSQVTSKLLWDYFRVTWELL